MATKIVAAPSRGAYTVKGTPGGVSVSKVPVAGSVVTGKQGVNWVYRPSGPSGAGFYKKPKPVAGAATTGLNASGATIQTPPVPTVASVTTSTPPSQDWWNNQMGAQIGLSATAPVLGAQQNQIGSSYGLVLRRDTAEGSATKGQPLFRLPSEKSGEGTIRQSGFDSSGNPVYKDAAGNVIADPSSLALDYVALKPGEAGYLQGALGSAAATSANTQQTIGEAAARAGVGKSGMREFGARNEASALQSALAGLLGKAGGEYTSNLGEWAKLYSQIYQGLVPQAAALAAPTETTVSVPAAPSAAPSVPESSYSGYNAPGTPSSGPLSGGPGGDFLKVIGNVTLERNTDDAAIRQGLRALLNNSAYKLTAQQKAYINSLIAGRYKGNKKY